MNLENWAAVDHYISDRIVPVDPVLEEAIAASQAAGLPPIAVSPPQGKLLQLLARMQAARRILEIGTLGGYSTIWLARALPDDGRIVTLELEARHAAVARANFKRAGVDEQIELRLGPAADSLAQLIAEKAAPFDLIFIDADKAGIPGYFAAALKLSRAGTAIVVDNVVRQGALADASATDETVRGVQRFHEQLAKETRVSATTIQTVGSKGYDGFTLAVVGGV